MLPSSLTSYCSNLLDAQALEIILNLESLTDLVEHVLLVSILITFVMLSYVKYFLYDFILWMKISYQKKMKYKFLGKRLRYIKYVAGVLK